MRRQNSKLNELFRNDLWKLSPYRRTPIKNVPSSEIRTHINWFEGLSLTADGDKSAIRLFQKSYYLALKERKYRIRKKNEKERSITD